MSGRARSAARNGDRPSSETMSEDEVGAEHDEVAMGEVDEPHDAEDQAEPGGEERVEPAEQDALDDGIEPVHAAAPK
jgi:hypothetical protein